MKRILPILALMSIICSSVISCHQESVEILVTSISFAGSTLELTVGDKIPLDPLIVPDNATNKKINWSSSKDAVATVTPEGIVEAVSAGEAVITATSEDSGVNAKCEIVVNEIIVYELIDLGFSVKWASCNLGASRPEEYGGYYQWAGTQDVSDLGIDLDLSNCPYFTGRGWVRYNPNSSYGIVDDWTVLYPEDDAATVALGGKWRIPTAEEWTDLLEKCNWTWTTLNKVDGYKVQSNMSGYSDNWIFLPAAGCRLDESLHRAGLGGCYWSSSLNTSLPNAAYDLAFSSDRVSKQYDYRYRGCSVRPVSD